MREELAVKKHVWQQISSEGVSSSENQTDFDN